MWLIWGTGEALVGRPETRIQLRRPRCRWEEILEWIYKKWDGEARTG
jgi:hypothetical protein